MRRLALLTALLCAALLIAFAQTGGQITGVVNDPSGALIPNASVTVTNTATNVARSTQTNSAGLYSFPDMPPGVYDVKVSMAGFDTVTKAGIEVQVQAVVRADFALAVGQATQTIEVAANGALLSTENATVGTVIEEQRIMDLPLNGRSYFSLVALSPNVTTGFVCRRAGQRPPGRLARLPHHRRHGRAVHLGELYSGRHHQHRHRLQHLHPAAVGGCPSGIQGPVGHLPGGIRPGTRTGQRRHQTRHQRIPRSPVGVPAQRQARRRALRLLFGHRSADQPPSRESALQTEPVWL